LQISSILKSHPEPGLIPEAGGNAESKEFSENTKMLGIISCALLAFLIQKELWKELRLHKPSM